MIKVRNPIMQNLIRSISSAIHTKPLLIIFSFWTLMQFVLLLVFGVVTTGEATKYYNEARNLLQSSHYSEPKYLFYSSYIFLHILFIKLNFETTGVYLAQLALNFLSVFLFYKLALTVSKNLVVAFMAGLLLAICYPWQYWAVHLYTESLFCPLIIIFTYFLFGTHNKGTTNTVALLCLFLLILFGRPTGILFVPVICLLFIVKLIKQKKIGWATIISLTGLVVFISVLQFAMKGGTSYDFMKPLIENDIICDVPRATMKHNSVVATPGNNLESIWLFIRQNPIQFLKLGGLKFLSYWGMTRTYYDTLHNIGLMCFFYPLYFFAIVGLRQLWNINKLFLVYIVSLLTIFTLSVMFTCDDWNNRFNMPIIPFVLLLASFGIKRVYYKFIHQ